MVRVFRCHSFASQGVIPVSKEPLSICTDNDFVFIATRDCEIIIYQVTDAELREVQRCPTISEVDVISYNNFKNYILTIELKKSWKRETKSVYVYLNWNHYNKENGKPRTKVSVAGRSHIQHASTPSCSDIMEIIELPVDGNASSLAVCKSTGNFAVACRSEVKLCSIVEKTVANSDKTYLDVEVFLELKWGFPIRSMSLCEEFMVCCSHKEVHGIRIRFDEGKRAHSRPMSKLLSSSSLSPEEEGPSPASLDKTDSAQFYLSDTFSFQDHLSERVTSLTFKADSDDSNHNALLPSSKDFSSVGMRPGARQSPKLVPQTQSEAEIQVVDDVNFVEWNFQSRGVTSASGTVCLPGLHSASTLSQCHHHTPSPPVLSDLSGGKVKSSSRVQAETILHLSDSREKEDWISVTLVPTYGRGVPAPVQMSSVTTDRMKSAQNVHRTSMCCYVSGSRGGYLYNMNPSLTQVSSYKYTDQALQVGLSPSYLHVMTTTGIETYTSRWGIVSVEMSPQDQEGEDDVSCQQSFPPSSLDICLCGHEPFFNAVSLSIGRNFLALLSKVYDSSGKDESHWSIYVLHMHSLVDQYKEMIGFAEGIQKTGPASYIHLLQEAHLLLSTHPSALTEPGSNEAKHYLREVNRLLGDYYAQPGQEDWSLCCAYYKNCKATVHDIVMDAMERAVQNNQREFGIGLLEYLDSVLFSQDDYVSLSGKTSDVILQMYASSAPEKLSKVILLSNMKSFTTEIAYHFLKTWLSVKSSNSQTFSTIDKLAMAQLQLALCDVESACSQLMSIHRPGLVDVCSSHLSLVCENMSTFTPLAQLMRQHMANTLLEVLVEMLDKCVISLDSLLSLLNSQSDTSYNSHTREVLELILTDSKRIFLFEEAVHILCKMYMALITEKIQPSTRQLSLSGQMKFSLPQGDGYFAPRFAWLDHLPPFYGPERMSRPCAKLEIKQIPGQSSRGSSVPLVTKQANNERCHCCSCNETLLKLQSLLCSPKLSTDLATFVLAKLEESRSCDSAAAPDEVEYLESISILCLTKLDLERATEQIVEKYPFVAGSFASCCFKGSLEKYQYLMAHMELMLKKFNEMPGGGSQEEMFVKAYKDLLTRLTETFTPSQFLELLPADGNIFFLLPFICASLKLEHVNKLKRKIIDMGKSLLSQNS